MCIQNNRRLTSHTKQEVHQFFIIERIIVRILDIFMLRNRKKNVHYLLKDFVIFFYRALVTFSPDCLIPDSVSLEIVSEISVLY